jgi:hypothetical protein
MGVAEHFKVHQDLGDTLNFIQIRCYFEPPDLDAALQLPPPDK